MVKETLSLSDKWDLFINVLTLVYLIYSDI